jgi:hypothetical protein
VDPVSDLDDQLRAGADDVGPDEDGDVAAVPGDRDLAVRRCT